MLERHLGRPLSRNFQPQPYGEVFFEISACWGFFNTISALLPFSPCKCCTANERLQSDSCTRSALAMPFALVVTSTELQADTAPPVVATLTGAAQVKDGGGLLFGRVEVRLQGVAAPEVGRDTNRREGALAKAALEQLVGNAIITCYLDGTTANSNRPVGVCYIGTDDLGEILIRSGYARDCPAFSLGRYAEQNARRG